jgi:hypothetical protein
LLGQLILATVATQAARNSRMACGVCGIDVAFFVVLQEVKIKKIKNKIEKKFLDMI